MQSLNFLLWVGIVLAVVAAIVWLIRMITGSRSAAPSARHGSFARDGG